MYVAQQCFGLSDETTEDALFDSQAIRRFVGIDLNREATPLVKNTAQLFSLLGFANLLLARRWLCAADSQVAP